MLTYPQNFEGSITILGEKGTVRVGGVELRTRHTWTGWDDAGALTFDGPDGPVTPVHRDATVLALGGASWPRTGSDGRWVAPLEGAGIDVRTLRPANVGFTIAWSDHFRTRFGGCPLKNVALRVAHRGIGEGPPGFLRRAVAGHGDGQVDEALRAAVREPDRQAGIDIRFRRADGGEGLTAPA